jgi:hypothetical protein
MPLTLRAQQWSTFSTDPQSQSESKQAAHTWSQGLDEISWMETNECSPCDEMDPGRNESLAFPPGGLTLPSMSGSTEWITHRAQQFQQGALNGLPQSNGSLNNWATPDFCQSTLFDDPSPSTPGTSPTFLPVHNSATLPSFVRNVDYQNNVPSIATSGSFSPVFDKGSTSYQFSSTTEAPLAHSLVTQSPSNRSNIAEILEEAPKLKAKRGRPRLLRDPPSTYNNSGSPIHVINESSASHRTPHNEVEKKYRNGLNAELERLRELVSTTTQNSSDSARLSKAMVLASAIECIKTIEATRDELQVENQGLRRRNKKLRRDKKTTAGE